MTYKYKYLKYKTKYLNAKKLLGGYNLNYKLKYKKIMKNFLVSELNKIKNKITNKNNIDLLKKKNKLLKISKILIHK